MKPKMRKTKAKSAKMTPFAKKKLHFFAHLITWAGHFFAFSAAASGRCFLALFLGQNRAKLERCRARDARARVDCDEKRHFWKVNQHGMERFAFYADGLKTHRPKGVKFLKNGKYSFWVILGPPFSPKKFYYSLGFSVVFDDLILTFCKIVLGPVTYR